MERKVAFLVYPSWTATRRADSSFDGVSNIGAYMLMDVAARGGVEIDFCSVDSAREFDVVLVSLTSIYDVLSFYRQVRRHRDWQKGVRKFRVLCGGFGLQNPMMLLDFVDSFWFGRCEDEFLNWITIDDYEHESLMTADKPKVCKIHQAACLYPHTFKLHTSQKVNNDFTETIMGCPNKCFFCHFSFARKHINTGEHYSLDLYQGTNSQEIDAFNIDALRTNVTDVTVGMDGFSDRLRFSVNKKITDDKMVEVLQRISNQSTIKGEHIKVKLYNITDYETETNEDYLSFVEVLKRAATDLRKSLIVVVHTTPLHPSPATPMVYAPVDVFAKLPKAGEIIIETERLVAYHSRFNPSNRPTLEALIVERFTEEFRPLLDAICFNNKLRVMDSSRFVRAVSDNFDIENLVREYGVDEQVPSWCCESYYGWEAIRRLRTMMKNKLVDK